MLKMAKSPRSKDLRLVLETVRGACQQAAAELLVDFKIKTLLCNRPRSTELDRRKYSSYVTWWKTRCQWSLQYVVAPWAALPLS